MLPKPYRPYSLLAAAMLLTAFGGVSYAVNPGTAPGPVVRDGSHDFDFEMGKWKMHNRRLAKKFANSHDWVEFDSYSEAHQMSGVIGDEDVYRTDYFKKGFVGLTYRLYDPRTGLWSIYWVDNLSMQGTFLPPVVGKFTGNVGVFEGPDTYDGKPIVVRYTWTVNPKGSPITAHFEQAFSADGGKTWEPNFVNDLAPAGK
jgi:hypothetical protein